MKFYKCLMAVLLGLTAQLSVSQGPPITADKPIMLGGKSSIIKTLTEIRNTNQGTFVRVPLMIHYLPTSNSLVAVHLPYVHYNFSDERGSGSTLGDINILAKYQFYRKDGTGKTFRMVAKTLQTLPTGEEFNIEGISTGVYQSYFGVVAGYESLKYGISNEIGYNLVPEADFDSFSYKLGFGLPLLKPTYPVDQINLYFEYINEYRPKLEEYELFYAQGIQYAKKQWTWEAAVQWPLIQNNVPESVQRNYSIFLGTRYVF
ncbi:hypothetical protein [Winogradskyella sp. A3E31]|uniref:hypothetical protein n=1 Tax=Winogradskyella sp. A3E31 TaxID=3349637 RepID=UPI00398A7E5A